MCTPNDLERTSKRFISKYSLSLTSGTPKQLATTCLEAGAFIPSADKRNLETLSDPHRSNIPRCLSQKDLAVEAQQVVPIEAGAADGRLMVEAGVWAVPVVVVQP